MIALVALLVAAIAAGCLPEAALAHSLGGRLSSPLPFVAYLGGAAIAVALSFFFVAISDAGPPREVHDRAGRTLPRWARLLLRGIGLIGWLWIVAQTLIGVSGEADVSYLFVWIYGWVGLAIVSALIGPLWSLIDPFSTLHDVGALLLRRFSSGELESGHYPAGSASGRRSRGPAHRARSWSWARAERPQLHSWPCLRSLRPRSIDPWRRPTGHANRSTHGRP